MGNTNNKNTTTEYKRKCTHAESYTKGLSEDYRIYKTKKGTYMLWCTDGDDIKGYLIKGVYDDIEYFGGPLHFIKDGNGAWEKGEIYYHNIIRFKRCVSNKNVIKPVSTQGYAHQLVWIPFMPKSARIAQNISVANEQKEQKEIIHKIILGEKIKLRNDCGLWYRKS